jgi:hypothetical protein
MGPKPLPTHNMIGVMSYDTVSSSIIFDAYTVGPGLDNATKVTPSIGVITAAPMRMDVDEGTGHVYLMHDSTSSPGVSAVTVLIY